MTSAKLTWLALVLAAGCAPETELELLTEQHRASGEDARAERDSGGDAGSDEQNVPNSGDAGRADGATVIDVDDGGDEMVEPINPGIGGHTNTLLLRYDFGGQGTSVVDLVGDANAAVLGGATMDGSGSLALDGRNDYVDLPNGVISQLTDASIVVWFEWFDDNKCWERVFDFGSNDAGEGSVGRATTSLFFTPKPCGGTRSTLMAELFGRQGTLVGSELRTGRRTQMVVTYEASSQTVRLYLDGRLQSAGWARFTLTQINDVNSWLGRSQWVQDTFARLRYDEFRIYGIALNATQVADIARAGPDVLPDL